MYIYCIFTLHFHSQVITISFGECVLLNNDRFTHVCITTYTDEVSIGFPLSFSSFFFFKSNKIFFANLIVG